MADGDAGEGLQHASAQHPHVAVVALVVLVATPLSQL
jgi:hypothetical protein